MLYYIIYITHLLEYVRLPIRYMYLYRYILARVTREIAIDLELLENLMHA